MPRQPRSRARTAPGARDRGHQYPRSRTASGMPEAGLVRRAAVADHGVPRAHHGWTPLAARIGGHRLVFCRLFSASHSSYALEAMGKTMTLSEETIRDL